MTPTFSALAKLLIDQHGDDAAMRTAGRANDLADEGESEGSAVWRRILEAIGGLKRDWRESLPRSGE